MLALIISPGVLADDAARHEAELFPGAGQAVRGLNDAGWRVLALLARMDPGRDGAVLFPRLESGLREALRGYGARLTDAIAPEPLSGGMPPDQAAAVFLPALLRRYRAEPAESVVFADSLLALEAAAQLGCRRVLVRTGRGAEAQARGIPSRVLPVAVYTDLGAAVRALCGRDA